MSSSWSKGWTPVRRHPLDPERRKASIIPRPLEAGFSCSDSSPPLRGTEEDDALPNGSATGSSPRLRGRATTWTAGNRQREVFADAVSILGSGDFSVDFLNKVAPHIFDAMVEALSGV